MRLLDALATGSGAAALRRLRAPLPRPRRRSARAARGGWPRREPLRGAGPPGVDRAWSSAPHEGVARDLVVALKFRRLLPVAELMADRIHRLAPAGAAAAARSCRCRPRRCARWRAASTRPPRSPRRWPSARGAAARAAACARRGGGRQVGRRRAERLGQPAADRGPRRGARAASCWSTTCSPPGRRSPPAPGPCAAPARSGSSPSPSPGGCERRVAVRRPLPPAGAGVASEADQGGTHMRIEIRGRNVEVDDELREHVIKRFRRVGKQVSELATLDVEISEERNPSIADSQVAEATLRLKGVTLRAQRGLAGDGAHDPRAGRGHPPPGQEAPRDAPQAHAGRGAPSNRMRGRTAEPSRRPRPDPSGAPPSIPLTDGYGEGHGHARAARRRGAQIQELREAGRGDQPLSSPRWSCSTTPSCAPRPTRCASAPAAASRSTTCCPRPSR